MKLYDEFKDDVKTIGNNLVHRDILSSENMRSPSSKAGVLCLALESISIAFGLPGVGTALGTAIALLMD